MATPRAAAFAMDKHTVKYLQLGADEVYITPLYHLIIGEWENNDNHAFC
jgi:hypothetical protein